MQDTKNKKLIRWLRSIYVIYGIIIITVFLDLCSLEYIKVSLFWGYVLDFEEIFTYDEGVMISSLLVVWTFLSAIILYYLGRKDEKFYGLSNMHIVFWNVSEEKKRKAVCFVFIQLMLLLLAVIIHLPITLVMLVFILPITVFYILWFVQKSTDDEFLQSTIIQIAVADATEKKGVLKGMLRQWDYSTEDSLLVLITVLIKYFEASKLDFNECSVDQEINVIGNIFERIKDSKEQRDFFKLLTQKITREIEGSQKIEVLTILVCAGIKNVQAYPITFCKEIVSVVQDEKLRRQMLLRGIVYNKYLESCAGKRNRVLVEFQLMMLITKGITSEDKVDVLKFMRHLNEKSQYQEFYWKDIVELLTELEE